MVKIKKALDTKALSNLLRDRGMRVTAQRIAVHEAMCVLTHASADQVYEYIIKHNTTSVTLSSVYNTLTQMARIGVYRNRLSQDNKLYFDVDVSSNLHLYDTHNHEFRDITDDSLRQDIAGYLRHKRFRGYKIDDVDVLILCHPTRKKKPLN